MDRNTSTDAHTLADEEWGQTVRARRQFHALFLLAHNTPSSITSGSDEARPCERGGVLAGRKVLVGKYMPRDGRRGRENKKKEERHKKADEARARVWEVDDAAKKKGDGGEIPEQPSQLRGGGHRWTERRREKRMDGQTAEGHVWISSGHQSRSERERERERERREGVRAPGRPQGGGSKPNPKNSCV